MSSKNSSDKPTSRSAPVTSTKSKTSANPLERIVGLVDGFQRKHPVLGFPYAVIKKYGDDQGGYQAALITYYGFLSLFPLLIVATSIIQMVSRGNDGLKERLTGSITSYFPAIGDSLSASIQTSSKTGLALIIGLLITFYGAKGVADAVQQALNHVWEVPRSRRPGFPKNTLRSLGIIVFAGLGALLAALVSGLATSGDKLGIMRILLSLGSITVLFGTFWGVFTYAVAYQRKRRVNVTGAAVAAIGFFILQTFGAYLITSQLKNQQGLGAQLAMVLALLFWIYLQAQVFLYAAEVSTVKHYKLWPRSLSGKKLTEGDKEAFKLYVKRETMQEPPEDVDVQFNKKTTSS